jgi:L-rhamnose-H+ transport protein
MSTSSGLLQLLVAGVMNASFTMPMKWLPRWAWENVWLLWAVFALGVFPVTLLVSTVPSWSQVYKQIGTDTVAIIGACGVGLGLCQVCFGLAVEMIGVGLTFAIASGVAAGVGSVVPLLIFHGDQVFTRSGADLLVGVLLVGCGVAVCAKAGRLREAALRLAPENDSAKMFGGLILAVSSGVTAASMNIGFDFGAKAIALATGSGVPEQWAANIVWTPMFLGALVPNLGYCLYLLGEHQTTPLFRCVGVPILVYWLSPILMALLWFGGIVLYGLSTLQLGTLGPALGWPLLESIIVIAASVLGLAAGEWRGSGQTPLRWQFGGVVILVFAVFVLSGATK